jgi:membrane protease YdiL (CAAX protease family)
VPQDRISSPTRTGGLMAHLKGHALLFDSRTLVPFPSSAGVRLLLIFLLLEGLIGPRLSLLSWLGLPRPPLWLQAPLLLGLGLILVRLLAGLKLSRIGLLPWRLWSTTEKSYFLQVIVLATVALSAISAQRLQTIANDPTLRSQVGIVVITYLIWGFYQEVVYRGILQTELQRRWGPWPAILAANVLFTFGPLHFYHWAGHAPLPMFAAIFTIGLFFGALFWRSGNLWIVGVFHGIGDVFLTGLGTLVR